MDNLTSLIIRGCKSKDPIQRLESIYKRFYYNDRTKTMECFTSQLASICDNYEITTIERIISKIYHELDMDTMFNEPCGMQSIQSTIYWALINSIRYASNDVFKNSGFRIPTKYLH